MTYNCNEIKKRVYEKRRKFILTLSATLLFMIVSLVLILLKISDEVTFICIVAEIVLMFVIYRMFDVQQPEIIFSKMIKGVNIKEDEYISRKTPGSGLTYRQVGGPASPEPIAPNTGANRRRVPPNIRSRVYIQLENGGIVTVSSLYKSHTALYEEGDMLLKYSGTQFPVIIGRSVSKQPCPICGEINDAVRTECAQCGLSIEQE